MEKNVINESFSYMDRIRKLLMVMKLCVILMVCFCMQLSASVFSQNQKVDISVEETSIETLIKEIKKQTEVKFLYNINELDRAGNVSIDMHDVTVNEVLSEAFKDKNLSYSFMNDVIVIVPKVKSSNKDDKEKTLVLKGKVTDTKGNPLPGVTVIVKKSNIGVSTNMQGEFELQITDKTKDAVLIFSFIGMQSKEIKVGDKKVFNVKLEDEISELDEIVVTGYQKIEKRKLASSVISVKGEDVVEGAALTVDNMLQGKIAGLAVLNPTSTPGAAPKIRIRGASSISGNREPVWVVDGVILEDPVQISSQDLNSLDKVNLIGNAISGLNPADIARIDILKDASATAIYGVKAANGVIVVTTKKGKIGKPSIRFSTSNTFKLRPDYSDLDRMNSAERIDVSKEIVDRGLTFNYTPGRVAYEGALQDLYDGIISQEEFAQRVQTMSNVNTDWYDELFETAFSTKNNLSISGGSDKINYYFSVGYTDDNANLKNTGVDQYNARTNLDFRLSEKLKIGVKLSGSSTDKVYQHTSIDAYKYAYETSRAIPAYNADGTYATYVKGLGFHKTPLNYNVLNEMEHTGRDVKLTNLNFVTTFDYKLIDALKLNGLFSVAKSSTRETNWAGEESYYVADLRGLNYGDPFPTGDDLNSFRNMNGSAIPYGGEIKTASHDNTSYTGRLNLNYMKRINDIHEVSANLGTEVRTSKYYGVSATTRGYLRDRGQKFVNIDPTIWKEFAYWSTRNHPTITDNKTNVMSFFGTLTYTYDNRYTANFNIRTDGSNKFGQDKSTRFLPVWSVSGRWNISNEKIFDNVRWLNLFALKGSYGIQGNVSPDQTPSLIMSLGNMDSRSGEYKSTLVRLPNPELKWEKTISTNFALEFALLEGRISGDFALYKKVGKDQIISKKVSQTTGASSMTLNAGDVENKGWEFTLNGTAIKTKDFTMGLSLNAYFNDNKVTNSGLRYNVGGTSDSYQNYYTGDAIIEGMPLNSFYSYRFNGLDSNGLPTFKGLEETDGITYDELLNNAFTYSGKMVPDFNGGFSTYFKYKGLSLDLNFAFSYGSKIRLNSLYKDSAQRLPRPDQNMSSEFVNRWQKAGDEKKTNIPVLTNDILYVQFSDNSLTVADNKWEMYNYSDLRVVSGDFIRLRNMTMRYKLPESLCNKLFFKSASIRCEATNLWLLADKKLEGRDPEQVGLGSGTVPPTKSFTIGFDITF